MPLDEDLCDACGYHRILKKVIDTTDVYKPNTETGTGFERMIAGQVAEFETTENALFWAKTAGVVLLAILCLLCLGKWGILILGLLGVAYFAWSAQVKKKAKHDETQINRDPFSVAAWKLLLVLQRAAGWRRLEWPFPKTRVLAMHDSEFTNEDLAALENLSDVETFDFEGAGITDEGLIHFEKLKRIQFLVLRGTGVTSDGVRRLQSVLPKACIWH